MLYKQNPYSHWKQTNKHIYVQELNHKECPSSPWAVWLWGVCLGLWNIKGEKSWFPNNLLEISLINWSIWSWGRLEKSIRVSLRKLTSEFGVNGVGWSEGNRGREGGAHEASLSRSWAGFKDSLLSSFPVLHKLIVSLCWNPSFQNPTNDFCLLFICVMNSETDTKEWKLWELGK